MATTAPAADPGATGAGLRVVRLAGHSFLSRPLGPSSLVLDLGVNHGEFSHAVIERFGCRVVGVEPVPALFASVPPDDRLTVEHRAITGDGGPATLFVNQTTCATIHAPLSQEEAPSVVVEGTTLEALLDRHHADRAALVKVDIEGAELQMLEHTTAATLRRVDQFTIEFHDFLDAGLAAPTRRAKQALREAGFVEFPLSRDNTDVLFVNSARLPFGPVRRAAVTVGQKYPKGIRRLVGRNLLRTGE